MLINLDTDMVDNEFLHSGDSTYKDNADINLINECKSTQSKEKENTEEDRTENNSTEDKIAADCTQSKPTAERENTAVRKAEAAVEQENNDAFFEVLDIYEANIGRTTAGEFMELSNAVKKGGAKTVTNAIYEAVKNNVKSMTGVKWYIDKNIENRCYS